MRADSRDGEPAGGGGLAAPSRRGADLAALGAGLVVTLYAALRAARVPVTHDEAYSFLRFVIAPASEAWSFRRPDAANNHLLLTLLDRVLVPLLGPSELVLRLPVLLALAAALAAAWLLLRRRCPPAVALAGFLVLACNRLVLELFSLARGYGLAIGLALCGLALLARAAESGFRPLPAAGGLSLLVVASLAQLTLLDVWAAASLAFAALAVRAAGRPAAGASGTRARTVGGALAAVAVPAAACAATAIPLAVTLKRSGALYAGGGTGLFADTVGSVVRETLEPAPWAGALDGPIAIAAAAVALGVLAGTFVLLLRRPGLPDDAGPLLLGSTFVLTLLAVEAQARLLGVAYPVDRIALPLVPLLVLAAALLAGPFLRSGGRTFRATANGISIAVSVAAVVQLVATADLTRSRLWWFDADSRSVVEHLDRLVAGRRAAPGSVSVAASWILEPGLNYYRVVGGRTWMRPVDRTGLGGRRDFYVVAVPDAGGDEARGLSALERFEAAGTLLAVAGPERLRSSVLRLVAAGALEEPVPASASADEENVAWIPVVVRARGLDGAEWRSDLRIANTLGSPATVLVTLRRNESLRQGAVGVPAGAEVTVLDVGGQLGLDGSAPLEVRTRPGVEVSASVYDASRGRPAASEASAWFRSVAARDRLGAGVVGRLEDLEESPRARTNVSLLNLGPSLVEVEISYLDRRRRVLGVVRRVLSPEESVQEARPLAAFDGAAPLSGASARVAVLRGEGVVAWATVIDTSTRAVRVVPSAR